jgi:hypothetical protein
VLDGHELVAEVLPWRRWSALHGGSRSVGEAGRAAVTWQAVTSIEPRREDKAEVGAQPLARNEKTLSSL